MRHAHGNCDIHTNTHRNSHSDANSDSYIYLDAHTNRNTYGNSNCDTHCYINPCHANANPHSKTCSYTKGSSHPGASPMNLSLRVILWRNDPRTRPRLTRART
jgi:hypothetical protein